MEDHVNVRLSLLVWKFNVCVFVCLQVFFSLFIVYRLWFVTFPQPLVLIQLVLQPLVPAQLFQWQRLSVLDTVFVYMSLPVSLHRVSPVLLSTCRHDNTFVFFSASTKSTTVRIYSLMKTHVAVSMSVWNIRSLWINTLLCCSYSDQKLQLVICNGNTYVFAENLIDHFKCLKFALLLRVGCEHWDDSHISL